MKLYIPKPLIAGSNTKTNYYAFGMAMQGRKFSGSSGYRYGFNGKENDDEIKGEGNSLDFDARILDTRLGRWLSVDPQEGKYPYFSPYLAFGNNPLKFIDPSGETLRVAGTAEAISKMESMISKSFSGKVAAKIVDGVFSIMKNEGAVLSEKEKIFFDKLTEISTQPQTVSINVISGDDSRTHNVLIADYQSQTLDLGDIEHFGYNPHGLVQVTAQGILFHEIVEQNQLQNPSEQSKKLWGVLLESELTKFSVAHDDNAKPAEYSISNYTDRTDDHSKLHHYTTSDLGGIYEGKLKLNLKTSDGKAYSEIHTVTEGNFEESKTTDGVLQIPKF